MAGKLKTVEDKKYKVVVDDGLNRVTVQATEGETLLAVLQRSGKAVLAPCGGKGTCRKCNVQIRGVGERLACEYPIQQDVEVLVADDSQFFILQQQNTVRKTPEVNSGISLETADGKNIINYRDDILIKLSGHPANLFGLAIDVGTTTVVVYLEDLETGEEIDTAAFVNPQAVYGADVISRVTHCIENENGLSTLQNSLITKIKLTAEALCQKNKIDIEQILKTAIVGNTVMLHILAGIDPGSIAFAPFTPVFLKTKKFTASELGLPGHPQSIVLLLPSIAGYVGADIAAGLATTDMLERDDYALYIDIGTNGEIALANRSRLICCATAAGPAFEGAKISCGTGGVRGAISEYSEDGISTIGGEKPVGICGSGLIDIAAHLLNSEIVNQMGYMEKPFLITAKEEAGIDADIELTPQDIREVQLAKAAIFAGMQVLIKAAGITINDISRLYLAGGFGNYIRVKSASQIGMLPKELASKTVTLGNAAGTGARFALHSIEFEDSLNHVAENAEYIELSNHVEFNEAYVEAMMFEPIVIPESEINK